MAFELSHTRSIDANVRRIAVEQLDEALELLRDHDPAGRSAAIHEARKRTKMVRALARLAQPGLGGAHRKVNIRVRDGARQLSDLRDAHALLATWNRITAVVPDLATLDPVRLRLSARAHVITDADADQRIERAIEHLEQARGRVERWDLPEGLGALRVGLRSSQRRGRRALRAVLDDSSDEHLHELRKRVKDLWYHGRLVRPSAPSLLDGYVSTLHDLSAALGDDHDLAVLMHLARNDIDGFGGHDIVDRLDRLLAPLRAELQGRSLPVAARVLAEPPKGFARRLAAYLELWYELGDDLPVGALDQVLDR
jgi:CHAD domain-containing protein